MVSPSSKFRTALVASALLAGSAPLVVSSPASANVGYCAAEFQNCNPPDWNPDYPGVRGGGGGGGITITVSTPAPPKCTFRERGLFTFRDATFSDSGRCATTLDCLNTMIAFNQLLLERGILGAGMCGKSRKAPYAAGKNIYLQFRKMTGSPPVASPDNSGQSSNEPEDDGETDDPYSTPTDLAPSPKASPNDRGPFPDDIVSDS
jgi:hypothetical protein